MESLHGLDGYEWQKIDASKNARLHSNMGNIYYKEKNYKAALKEYEIAYNLTSKKSQSSIYLYNIARCFMKTNQYKLAKNALEGAIKKDCMNLTYYNALAECITKLNIENQEIRKNLNDTKNPYSRILAGLIYLKKGENENAKFIFDEIITKYPDLLIIQDLKFILKDM